MEENRGTKQMPAYPVNVIGRDGSRPPMAKTTAESFADIVVDGAVQSLNALDGPGEIKGAKN